jgi:hypothetical protein
MIDRSNGIDCYCLNDRGMGVESSHSLFVTLFFLLQWRENRGGWDVKGVSLLYYVEDRKCANTYLFSYDSFPIF